MSLEQRFNFLKGFGLPINCDVIHGFASRDVALVSGFICNSGIGEMNTKWLSTFFAVRVFVFIPEYAKFKFERLISVFFKNVKGEAQC